MDRDTTGALLEQEKQNAQEVGTLSEYVAQPNGNLFNGYTNALLVTATGEITSTGVTALTKTAIIEMKQGKTYNIAVTGNNKFKIATYPDIILKDGDQGTLVVTNDALHSYSYTQTADKAFMYIYVSDNDVVPVMTVTSADATPDTIEEVANRRGTLAGRFTGFYKSAAYSAVGFTISTATAANMYGLWDGLVTSYPTIVSRATLGYATKSDGTADDTLPIYEYTVRANNQPFTPLVLVSCAGHGNEKGGPIDFYMAFSQMLSGWRNNELLMGLLMNATYKIIPVLNPKGVNTTSRYNARSVDLNRNFRYLWAAGANAGASALSELESQLLSTWLTKNNHAMLYIDHHQTYGEGCESYVTTANENVRMVYASVARTLRNVWLNDYPAHTQEGFYASGSMKPYAAMEAYHYAGIKNSLTLEIARDDGGTSYTAASLERGVDLVINFLLGMFNYINITSKPWG
jgi:predicted deacylase